MNTGSDRNELYHTYKRVSYNIHGVSTYKFKQIRNYESVIQPQSEKVGTVLKTQIKNKFTFF